MPCDVTGDFKVNCHRLSPCDRQLVLVEITHPFLTTSIKLAESKCPVLSEDQTYVPCAFEYEYHKDVENELPKATFSITNIGKPIMRWIEKSVGGKDGKVIFRIVRESTPNIIEFKHTYDIAACSATLEKISIDLVIQSLFIRRGVRRIFDPEHAPGIF